MLCLDLLREVSKYLTVKESLNMEVAVREKLFEIQDYKMRLNYEPYSITTNVFRLKGFYDKRFKCDVSTVDHHICVVSMYHVNSTKEACNTAIELFRLTLV